MSSLGELLERLERILAEVEGMDAPVRDRVFELLDGIDAIHQVGLTRLGDILGPGQIARLRQADPAVAWLFDAYAVGLDQRAEADAALATIRPYIHSHGGDVEVRGATAGVVRVKLSGSCSGCTASAVTLQHGVEEALREHMPGFVALEVEMDDAPAHEPPGLTLLQIQRKPAARTGPAPP